MNKIFVNLVLLAFLALAGAVFVHPAMAEGGVPAVAAVADAVAGPVADKGDTAWMLVATLLVVLMSVPGLGLFYGGMVRQKNMLLSFDAVSGCFQFARSALGSVWLQYRFYRRESVFWRLKQTVFMGSYAGQYGWDFY